VCSIYFVALRGFGFPCIPDFTALVQRRARMVGDMRKNLWVVLGVWGARVENQSEQHATRDHLLRDGPYRIPRVQHAGIPREGDRCSKNTRGQRSSQFENHTRANFTATTS
jgi:hypothetical protein